MEQIRLKLKEIESELEKNRKDAGLWMEHGVGHHLAGEYQQAVKSFRTSLGFSQKNPSCHFNLANSYMELEKIDKAIHHYLEAIELKADHIPSLTNLADAFEQAGQSEKSLEIFQYLIHLNPDQPLFHFNLGNFFLRNNEHREAATCYEKTLVLDESFVDAYYNIAWILKQVHAREEALTYVRDGLKIDPEHADLLKLAGELET